MKRSISSKIFLSFALILLLSTSVEVLGFLTIKKQLQEQTIQSLLQDAKSAASYIELFFTNIEIENQSVATEYVKNSSIADQQVNEFVSFILDQNRYYQSLTILSSTGKELFKRNRFSTTSTEDLSYEIQTDAFAQALDGKTGLSKVYFPEGKTEPYLDLFTPITSSEGDVIGAIKSQLLLASLWDVIAEVKREDTGFAYIVDSDGRLLAHPVTELVTSGENLIDTPVVSRLLSEGKITGSISDFIFQELNNTKIIANGLKVKHPNWIIIVQQDLDEAFAQLTLIENLFYPTLLITFILLSIIAYFISKSLTNPILKLRLLAEKIEHGNLDVRSDIQTGDEIQELSESFNAMTDSLVRSEAALARDRENITAERNKLEVVIAGINDAVIAVDLNGNIILFNRAAEQLTGYTLAEVSNKHIEELIQFIDGDIKISINEFCPKHEPGFEGIVFEQELILLKGKEGKEVKIDLVSSQIAEAESIDLGCILLLHDVSKEQALEDMKLDFVSLAAHELRTPLTAITGYLSVFISENEKLLNLDQLTMVTRASIAGQQLVGLVENLLNVSQIERGVVTLQVTPVKWPDTVRTVVSDLQNRAKDKSITLEFKETSAEIPAVYVDKIRITEVVNNLIANAINYTDSNGQVSVWLEVKNDEVLTYVKDTGVGIPKEALPNLFKKFFRVSGALEHGSKGTGLGLYISKSIIEMHRGKIWVESELGKGSTFIFSLPTKPYDQSTSD